MIEDAGRNAHGASTERAAGAAGVPRWVKWFLIAAAILVVVMVVVMAISGGRHGPGRHLSGTDTPRTAALVFDASGPERPGVRW